MAGPIPGAESLNFRASFFRAGDPIDIQPSSLTITNLSYTAGGPNCINRTWKQLFDPGNTNGPPVPASITDVPTSLPTNPLPATVGTCTVFQPGIYDDSFDLQKKLGASNYFLSGIYLFDDIGKIELKNKIVTMGQIDRQGYPAIANTACDNVRTAAVPVTGFPAEDGKGATLYTKGDTYFTSQSNSGFEISGRLQGTANVSLQVLTSTLKFNEPLLTSDNGNHKEVAMQGIVWAPYNSLLYETVPADKAAMLRGGAVVASYRGKVAASASGFLIEVATKPGDARLLIESTATDTRGSNTVRVVADYRPSTGELAVHSRRVVK